MPPSPVDDIDFPDLSDKILDVLRAIWTLICDVCLVIWSYISPALTAVWTWPPFETFRSDFSTAIIALFDYIVAHLVTSAAIGILVLIVVQAALNALNAYFLRGVGFGERGALHGAYAVHGRYVQGGPASARLQSRGTKAKGGGRYHAVGSSGWA